MKVVFDSAEKSIRLRSANQIDGAENTSLIPAEEELVQDALR